MARIPYSEQEKKDLQDLHLAEYLDKYSHLGRTKGTWGNQRNRLFGLHKNPNVDRYGNPWQVTPERTEPVEPGFSDPGFSAPSELSGNPGHLPTVTNVVGVQAGEKPDVEAIRQRAEHQFANTAKQAERKQHQHVYFDHGPVALFFVGDNHIGNPGSDVRQMFAEQDQILATPGARVVLMGDLVDNMVVGKLMAANLTHRTTNNEDWELARHYVERWGDRVIAYVGGNHTGGWTMRMLGLDLDKSIAPESAIYDLDDVRFTAHVGNHEVSIWARHKWQGSSIYSATHGQERAARFDTARHDVYVGAHIHRGAVAREFVVDRRRKVALLSSTYKHHDSFQRQEGFAANDMSTAAGLVINNDGSYFGSGNIAAVMNYMKNVYQGAA